MNALPPPNLPYLAPLPGQADVALGMVHRRRRRSAVRTASATCALAVAAAVLTTRGPGVSMLEQTNEGVPRTATAVPSPSGHGGETYGATGPRLATPRATETYGAAATPAPAPWPTETEEASPEPPRESEAPPRPRPDVVRTRNNAVVNRAEGPTPCTPAPMPTGGGWCGGLLYEKSADQVMFQLSICSASDGHALEFATEQEIDLVVRSADGSREHWRWGRGQHFAATRHLLVLGMEECVTWWVPWDYGDESGRRVPPGKYLVTLPVLATPSSEYGYYVTVE